MTSRIEARPRNRAGRAIAPLAFATALLAAALLALNPMAVWYSQEARAYAFVVLSACLAFGALFVRPAALRVQHYTTPRLG